MIGSSAIGYLVGSTKNGDWIMFSAVLGVVLAAAGLTLVDALNSRNKQLESLGTH